MRIFHLLAAVFVSWCIPAFGETYHIRNIGTEIGATNSYAHAVNDEGNVAGYFRHTNGVFSAFLMRAVDWSDLGVTGTNTYALSLNSGDHVVGFSESTNGATAFHFFSNTLVDLGTLGGLNSYAFGINALTNIAGYIDTTNGVAAILFSNGVTSILGNLGGTNSYAFGVNASNLVVGSSLDASNTLLNAFVWGESGMTNLNGLLPLGSGWFLKEARGINHNANIVGWGETNGIEYAFLLSGTTLVPIAPLPGGTNSYAVGLNDSNHVVGASSASNGVVHAFLWKDGDLHDLNDFLPSGSGWELVEARGINNAGQIVGWGTVDGEVQAFLLNPNSPPAVSLVTPENNAAVTFPADIELLAAASDSDGVVAKVEFFANGGLIATVTNASLLF